MNSSFVTIYNTNSSCFAHITIDTKDEINFYILPNPYQYVNLNIVKTAVFGIFDIGYCILNSDTSDITLIGKKVSLKQVLSFPYQNGTFNSLILSPDVLFYFIHNSIPLTCQSFKLSIPSLVNDNWDFDLSNFNITNIFVECTFLIEFDTISFYYSDKFQFVIKEKEHHNTACLTMFNIQPHTVFNFSLGTKDLNHQHYLCSHLEPLPDGNYFTYETHYFVHNQGFDTNISFPQTEYPWIPTEPMIFYDNFFI